LTVALIAGALAAFNPCGFALLPAYLAMFLGTDRGRGSAVARALFVGASVTVGFLIVFGLAGIAVSALSLRFGDWLSVVTALAGVLLLGAGIALLAGRDVSVRLPRAKLAVSDSAGGMVAYGVVYATVSLSCTLPVFMAAVISVFQATDGGPLAGVAALVAYGLGMGAVLTALALLVALFRDSALARMRAVTPYVGRISGAFLVLAGAYVIWYGWVEYRSFQGDFIAGGPVDWMASVSGSVSGWLNARGWPFIALLVALMIVAWFATRLMRHRTSTATAATGTLPEPLDDFDPTADDSFSPEPITTGPEGRREDHR
jgi:cytochrome c biogenesis protein CcdA